MIGREDKTIIKPWVCDIDLKFANGAMLFRGNIEGVQKGVSSKTSNVFYHTRKLGPIETCDLQADLKEDESSTIQVLS
jgi:hypothetical protein